MKVGQSVRAIRLQKGLTLDELSALCGVSRDDLGDYERGQATPRPGTVSKIAQALDVPLAAIRNGMGWTESAPPARWEREGGEPLREAILETVRESRGEAFTPDEADIQLLMESVKAAIPALVEHMKDTRPEADIHRNILAELDLQPPDSEETRLRQFALTDDQWERVRDLLPPEKSGKGRAFKSNRLVLDGIIYHIKSGTAWKDLPEHFGRYKCVSDRLRLWERGGVWEAVREELAALGVL